MSKQASFGWFVTTAVTHAAIAFSAVDWSAAELCGASEAPSCSLPGDPPGSAAVRESLGRGSVSPASESLEHPVRAMAAAIAMVPAFQPTLLCLSLTNTPSVVLPCILCILWE
ncbi:hypothetical protein ACIRPR_15825 [Streptomyces griseoflavus]|uniref:hypothetical protein n=1 Tax=Streptomyces griseoflavus TaxID=35619 RepID=UPI00167D47F7|nr:hypothetical protein [Streptomyces griseoflavus]